MGGEGSGYLEIAAIESTLRVDNHETQGPLEDVFTVQLRESGQHVISSESGANVPYLDVNPFLLLERLVLAHQTLLRCRRGRHDGGCCRVKPGGSDRKDARG